jgi:hypothetical protein
MMPRAFHSDVIPLGLFVPMKAVTGLGNFINLTIGRDIKNKIPLGLILRHSFDFALFQYYIAHNGGLLSSSCAIKTEQQVSS